MEVLQVKLQKRLSQEEEGLQIILLERLVEHQIKMRLVQVEMVDLSKKLRDLVEHQIPKFNLQR